MRDVVLYCPFVPRIHSLASEADRNAVQWARRHGLISTDQAAAKLQILKIGHLAGRTHPDAPAGSLGLIADWCAWFFEHDDICDEQLPDPQAVAAFHRPLKAIIGGSQQAGSGVERALFDLWQRTASGAPAGWGRRFARHLDAFFDSKVWEAQQRQRGVPPDLHLYIAQRPVASGMFAYIDLIEVSYEAWLAPEAWHALHELRALTARVCCWANDLISFERERAQGEVLNLVAVIMAGGLDERAAWAQAVDLHDDDVQAFRARAEWLRERAAGRGDLSAQALEHYIGHLSAYMRGNLDWTASAARYAMGLQREHAA